MRKFLLKPRHASRGMTLVEMLLVMAIFAIVMLAVMSLFIPAVKSTAVQTQVTDVQSNLRLAMNRITQDLLTAGFLIGDDDPIIFESGTDKDQEDFTIQTRAVGSGFARIREETDCGTTIPVSSTVLPLSMGAMVDNFPVGSKVRLFESVTAVELEGAVYTVASKDSCKLTLDGVGVGVPIPEEAVVIRIKDDTQPAMQTIRYRENDSDGDGNTDSLVRIVNGDTQILARNVSDVNFLYEDSASGRIHKVDVVVTGQTEAVGTDAVSSAKTRVLQTSVTLRNVF